MEPITDDVQVDDSLFRFVIPFRYENCDLSTQLEKTGEGWQQIEKLDGEQDLYENIWTIFDKYNPHALGSMWEYAGIYQKNEENKEIRNPRIFKFTLNDYSDNPEPDYYVSTVRHVGLYIINEIKLGFLWYELGDFYLISKEEYKNHCYTIKELNGLKVVTSASKLQEILYELKECSACKQRHKIIINEEEREYCKPYNAVVHPLFEKIKFEGLQFLPQRRSKKENKVLPDKACIFSYIYIEPAKEERNLISELGFHFGHVYKKSYHASENELQNQFEPFRGSCWTICQEGINNTVQSEEAIFKRYHGGDSTYKRRMRIGYFHMYVLCLMQYYGALCIQNDIFKTDDRSMADQVLKVQNFRCRNMFSQVSHITHQNELFDYMQQKLKIWQLVLEVENAADTIKDNYEIQVSAEREERNKKTARRMKYFSFCSAEFALISLACGFIQALSCLPRFASSGCLFSVAMIFTICALLLAGVVWLIWFKIRKEADE